MATALFEKIIFGPIQSRRLGVSLGVNLLDPQAKICNFDCVYCECGWNGDNSGGRFNKADQVLGTLEQTLEKMSQQGDPLDYITFAGNGEPTTHPDFLEIIEGTIAARDKFFPSAKIAVLTNATMIEREDVRRALDMVDRNILKFDSAIFQTYKLLNRPARAVSIEHQVELLSYFSGRGVIQTMFLRGEIDGVWVDNTSPEELEAWLAALKKISPAQVMVYSLDRDTPMEGLQRVSQDELERIEGLVCDLFECE